MNRDFQEARKIMTANSDNNKEVPNVLIKVSGDLTNSEKILSFIEKQTKENYVVVLIGGGTGISKALEEDYEKRGEKYIPNFIPGLGRKLDKFEDRQIARNALEKNQQILQNKLIGVAGVVVVMPVIYMGEVLVHMNADNLAKIICFNFDKTWVLTTKGKKETKDFSGCPNLEVKEI